MAERKPLIAGNWKMFKTGAEAVETAKKLADLVGKTDTVDMMIAPPYTALSLVATVLQDTNIGLSAQNMHWAANGAYTGEISSEMLCAAGCQYVILGHSERRQYFHETDDHINQKIHATIGANLIPVFCVGETEDERNLNKTFSVLDNQIEIGLKGINIDQAINIIIAYEPVWAIGTGKTATDDQAQAVHSYVRKRISDIFNVEVASTMRILYGGSVKPNNIKGLMTMPDIDGALVGGASLDADQFAAIIKYQ